MGRSENIRDLRRDQLRVAQTIKERYNPQTEKEWDSAFKKYIGKTGTDDDFKRGVRSKYEGKYNKLDKMTLQEKKQQQFKEFKEKKKAPDVEFVFTARTRKSNKVLEARFDRTVNRYRDKKGRFVKKI